MGLVSWISFSQIMQCFATCHRIPVIYCFMYFVHVYNHVCQEDCLVLVDQMRKSLVYISTNSFCQHLNIIMSLPQKIITNIALKIICFPLLTTSFLYFPLWPIWSSKLSWYPFIYYHTVIYLPALPEDTRGHFMIINYFLVRRN